MNPKSGVHIPHDERYAQSLNIARRLNTAILKDS